MLGHRLAAELGRVQHEAEPLGVHPGVVALLERLGHRHRAVLRVVDRRVAVGVLERRRQLLAGQPVDLAEDRPRRVDVDLLEQALPEDLVTSEHLEQVELDVPDVALVVAHCSTFETRRYRRPTWGPVAVSTALLISNIIMLPASRQGKPTRRTSRREDSPVPGEVGAPSTRSGSGTRRPATCSTSSAMPSNLLAHHLRTLEGAGLVVRPPLEADRRRTYLQLDPAALDGPAAARWLRRGAARGVRVHREHGPLPARGRPVGAGQRVPAASAGTHPADARRARVRSPTARRHGLPLARDRPAVLDDVLRARRLVVTVCDHAHEELDRETAHGARRPAVCTGRCPTRSASAPTTAFDRRLRRPRPARHALAPSRDPSRLEGHLATMTPPRHPSPPRRSTWRDDSPRSSSAPPCS